MLSCSSSSLLKHPVILHSTKLSAMTSKRQVHFEENDAGYLSDCQCSNSNVLRHYHQYQEEEILRMTSLKNNSPTSTTMKESPSNDIQISLSLPPDSATGSNHHNHASPKLDSLIEWIRTGPLKSKQSSIRESKSPQRRNNVSIFDTLDRRRASVDPTLLMDAKSHSHEGTNRYYNPFNSILRRDKQKRHAKNEIQYHSTGCVNIRPSSLTLNAPAVYNGCDCGDSDCVDKLSSSFTGVGRSSMKNSQDLRRAAAIGSMMSRSLLDDEEVVGAGGAAAAVAASRLQQRRSTLSAETLSANQGRARSGSTESGRYLLLRRTLDPTGSSECLGSFEEDGEQAYRQLLSNLQCYNVMPAVSKLVIIDSKMPVRKALLALVSNVVKAAVVFDSFKGAVSRLITSSDLIYIIKNVYHMTTNEKLLDESLDSILSDQDINGSSGSSEVIFAELDDCLYKAARICCSQSLNRLLIFDDCTKGNPIFLLSKLMVLRAFKKYMEFLPLPSFMFSTLDELRIGQWDLENIETVDLSTKLSDLLGKFIAKKFSVLPVLKNDASRTVVNVISKASLINLLIEQFLNDNRNLSTSLQEKTVEDALKYNEESVITCSPKATFYLAMDRLVRSDSRVLLVVDGDNHLQALVATGDILMLLLRNFS